MSARRGRVSWTGLCLFALLAGPSPPGRAAPPVLPGVRAFPLALDGAVHDLAQDDSGRLWIGSEDGLLSFDGHVVVRDRVVDARDPRRRFVRRVLPARDGSLWLATGRVFLDRPANARAPIRLRNPDGPAELLRLHDGELTVFTVERGLPGPWVFALAEAPDGTLWVGTDRGLARFDGRRFLPAVEINARLGGRPIVALRFDDDGRLWVGGEHGLAWLRAGRLEATGSRDTVFSLSRMGAGRIAVGFAERVDIYEGRQRRRSLAGIGVRAAVTGPDGHPWLFGDKPPVRVLADATQAIKEVDLRRVYTAFADLEGNVWTSGTGGPLLRISAARVWNLSDVHHFAGSSYAVLATRDGSVWFTSSSGLGHLDGETFSLRRTGTDLPVQDVRGLAEGPDGSLWVAARRDGVLQVKGEALRFFSAGSHYAGLTVRSLAFDARGRLFVAGEEGVVIRHDEGYPVGAGRRFEPKHGLCPGHTLMAGPRREGGVWYSSASDGFGYVDDEGAHCIGTAQGLPLDGVLAVHEDADGMLWLSGSGETGIVRWDGKRFFVIPREAGLPSANISGIVPEGREHLWFATSRGVFRAERSALLGHRSGDALGPVFSYRALDGMRSEVALLTRRPVLTMDSLGRVWTSTLRGISVLAPPQPLRWIPRIRLSSVTADTAAVPWRGQAVFPAATQTIRFDFGAVALTAAHRIQYQFRLDGYTRGWQSSAFPQVVFRNLRPGRYALFARARDDMNQLGPVLGPLSFSIALPWWARWQIWLSALLGAALLFVIALRLRLRAVEARHALVLQERARIARDLHDSLAQGFAALQFQLDGAETRLPAGAPELRTSLDQMKALVKMFRAEARQAVWNLRALDTAPLPWLESLRQAAERAALGARVELQVAPDVAADKPISHPQDLSFIVQEAVTNAVTHGRASEVALRLAREGHRLLVEITDNGAGLSAASPQVPGMTLGITGMRERAQRTGGSVSIDESAPRGVRVTVLWPVVGD